ncbi:hypothetical protein ACQYAD_11700 [Neobacillus sp. SM06]
MKICEVCGAKEEVEANEEESFSSVILHVCENCREDRKLSHFEDFIF